MDTERSAAYGEPVAALSFLLATVAVILVWSLFGRTKALSDRLDRAERDILRMKLALQPNAQTRAAPEPMVAPPTRAPSASITSLPLSHEATPPRTVPSQPPVPALPHAPLEERIAFWFTRAGAGAFLLGMAYFLKYAVDNDWVGPLGRLALGALVGVGALAAAEALWRRALPAYTQILEGIGLCVLLGTGYASFALYQIAPVPVAFAAIFVTALLGGALAVYHRGESILLLSLVGATLAPVLLSTGSDHPGGLFSYVALVTILALAASLRARFRFAPWLAVAGTLALFTGWYLKFFVSEWGAVAESYRNPDSRAVPLAAVLAFSVEWLWCYRSARKRGFAELRPEGLLLAALLFAHAGAGALLFDKPLWLGAAFVALSAASIALLLREGREDFLAVVLFASFVILGAVARGVPSEAAAPLLVALGLWAGLYAAAYLRGQSGRDRQLSVKSAVGAGAACGALALVAFPMLFAPHPLGFAGLLAALSLPLVTLAVLAATPILGLFALAGSMTGLVALAETGPHDLRVIAVAGAWAAIYVAGASWDLLRKQLPASPFRLLILSGAGLGFIGLAVIEAGSSHQLLLASLLGAVGAVDLGLGLGLLRFARDRRAASVVLGQAMALFFGAAALLLSGVTVTLAWATMAATVTVLAAQAKDRHWLLGAGALFGVTILRLISIDLRIPILARERFIETLGSEGAISPHALFNPRAYAFLACAAALFVGARQTARVGERVFHTTAAAFATSGHALLLTLGVLEAYEFLVHWPPLPVALGQYAGSGAYSAAVAAAVQAQAGQFSVVASILSGVYALLLLGVGFVFRERLHRYLGLGLFTLTLSKLGLWDIWTLPRAYQIWTLVSVGTLLLVGSYLYANRKRLPTAILNGGGGAAAVAFGLLALSTRARASVDPSLFTERRPITGVQGPGLYHAEVDPALYRASRDRLQDLRIVAPDGVEIPFFVRDLADATPVAQEHTAMVDPVELPGGGCRATFDLGRVGRGHSEIRLSIDGQNFLRSTLVESSSDELHFAPLARGARVYRVEAGNGSSESLTVRYPASDARYLRITLLGKADGQELRITGGQVGFVAPGPRPAERWIDAPIETRSHDPQAHATVLELDLGAPGVPLTEVALSIATAAFERRAQVEALAPGGGWPRIGGGLLFRAPAAGGGLDEGLHLGVSTDRARLRIEIFDQDDAPLEVQAVRVRYRAQDLVFRTERAGPLSLYVGSDRMGAPSYDLAQVIAREDSISPAPATLGPLAPNPTFTEPAPPPAHLPSWTDRHARAIGGCLAVLLLGLAGWTALLLKGIATHGANEPRA